MSTTHDDLSDLYLEPFENKGVITLKEYVKWLLKKSKELRIDEATLEREGRRYVKVDLEKQIAIYVG